MKTPYEILEVTEQASDSEIKQAYLQMVKLNPPDRDQETFQQLHSAYETIKNITNREKYALFTYPEVNFDTLLNQAFASDQPVSMNAEHFENLLRASVDGKALLNTQPGKSKA